MPCVIFNQDMCCRCLAQFVLFTTIVLYTILYYVPVTSDMQDLLIYCNIRTFVQHTIIFTGPVWQSLWMYDYACYVSLCHCPCGCVSLYEDARVYVCAFYSMWCCNGKYVCIKCFLKLLFWFYCKYLGLHWPITYTFQNITSHWTLLLLSNTLLHNWIVTIYIYIQCCCARIDYSFTAPYLLFIFTFLTIKWIMQQMVWWKL